MMMMMTTNFNGQALRLSHSFIHSFERFFYPNRQERNTSNDFETNINYVKSIWQNFYCFDMQPD